jgi:hypothetical protein
MRQSTSQGPTAMALSRTVFRLINRWPPLKRKIARGMGED